MDNANAEIKIVETVLRECVTRYATSDARMFTVFDQECHHFLVIEEGWLDGKHLYNPFVHIELKGKTIWIQQDYTNHGIANDLVRNGVPKGSIVLG